MRLLLNLDLLNSREIKLTFNKYLSEVKLLSKIKSKTFFKSFLTCLKWSKSTDNAIAGILAFKASMHAPTVPE